MKLRNNIIIITAILSVVFFVLYLNIGRIEVDAKMKKSPIPELTESYIRMKKGILFMSIQEGDYFSGIIIDVIKINKYYNIQIHNYTDRADDNIRNNYKILNKNIILDKDYYKQGDSIFGKISLEISSNNGKPYILNSYVRGIIR